MIYTINVFCPYYSQTFLFVSEALDFISPVFVELYYTYHLSPYETIFHKINFVGGGTFHIELRST